MSPNPQELKGLVDSTPDASVLLNLAGYYAKRQLPEKGVDSEVVYDCPRTQVMVRTAVKGTQIGAPLPHRVRRDRRSSWAAAARSWSTASGSR
ncbi:MAG: hypothetical protein MZV70_49270 [Desulfobacterales bacterium]|nr:hypothetical protein [Desulfobacterales bacterium]